MQSPNVALLIALVLGVSFSANAQSPVTRIVVGSVVSGNVNEPWMFGSTTAATSLCGGGDCIAGSTYVTMTTNSTSLKLYLDESGVVATSYTGGRYTISYSLDSATSIVLGTYSSTDYPVLLISGLSDGVHTLSLFTTVVAGSSSTNTPTSDVTDSSTPVSFSWNVDTDVPVTSISNTPDSINNVAGSGSTGIVVSSSKAAEAPTTLYGGYLIFYCSFVKKGNSDSFSACSGVNSAGTTLSSGIVATSGLDEINATYTPSSDGDWTFKSYVQYVPYCTAYSANTFGSDVVLQVTSTTGGQACTGNAAFSDLAFSTTDGSGNRDWSSDAYTAGATWTYDGTAPTVVITKSPTGSPGTYSKSMQFFADQTGKFEFSCNDQHSCTYQCSVNGKDSYISNSTSASPGTFACTSPVNVYFKPTGTTAFTMTATDVAGNVSPWSKVYRIYTDNTGPEAKFAVNSAYISTVSMDSTNADDGYYPTAIDALTQTLTDGSTAITGVTSAIDAGAAGTANVNEAVDFAKTTGITTLYDTVLEVKLDITREVYNLPSDTYGTILAYRTVNGNKYANVLLSTQSPEGTLSFTCSHPEFLN